VAEEVHQRVGTVGWSTPTLFLASGANAGRNLKRSPKRQRDRSGLQVCRVPEHLVTTCNFMSYRERVPATRSSSQTRPDRRCDELITPPTPHIAMTNVDDLFSSPYCNIACRQRITDLNMQTRVAVSSGQTEGLQSIAAEDPVCTTSKKGPLWARWTTTCKIKTGSRRKPCRSGKLLSSGLIKRWLHQASLVQTRACTLFPLISRTAVLS